MSKIAFIGLGNMGGPMVANLIKAGHELRVFDLVHSALDTAHAAGAQVASSASDTLHGAEVVISMLPASKHVEGLYLGDAGILAHIPAGALVIDCSTIAPAMARTVATAAHARGLDMLDAPVSGGTAGAAAGTLVQVLPHRHVLGGGQLRVAKRRELLRKRRAQAGRHDCCNSARSN